MRSGLLRPAPIAIGAALLSAGLALPAHADLVFRMANSSNVEAKGSAQNVKALRLRRGETIDIRVEGDWFLSCSTLFGNCNRESIPRQFVVNFENLANAGDQYCVWKVTWSQYPGEGYRSKIEVKHKLEVQKAGFTCEVGGQTSARYTKLKPGESITMHFRLRNQ